MKAKFNPGDRVLIIKSPYLAHPSRMPGAKGTVLKVEAFINTFVYIVNVDDDPPYPNGSVGNGWAFNGQELARTT